jgi:hypothetical protein
MRQYVCVDHSSESSSQQRDGEEDIQVLLEFKRRPLESLNFTHYGLYCPFLISRPLALVLELSSSVSHTCDGRSAHHPSTTTALLAKHLGDCDGEGLRGHVYVYATRTNNKNASLRRRRILACCASRCLTNYAVSVGAYAGWNLAYSAMKTASARGPILAGSVYAGAFPALAQ